MNDEISSENKENKQEKSGTWEGRLGRRHFRVQWNRGPDAARFNFQAPFATDEDPDGVGTAFAPDLGVVWERGRGTHAYGAYTERLGKLQSEAPVVVEKVVEELEAALATVRRRLSERRASLQAAQNAKKPQPQRVRIEYEEVEDLFEDDLSTISVEGIVDPPVSREEREARRRKILEAFGAGTISLAEAEIQLDSLAKN